LNLKKKKSLAKNRREAKDFIGAEAVINHLKNGPPRRRVGFIVDEAPARGNDFSAVYTVLTHTFSAGAEIFSKEGELIGN
jgi:aminomethyltransferase